MNSVLRKMEEAVRKTANSKSRPLALDNKAIQPK
jgi:hypothetical protein